MAAAVSVNWAAMSHPELYHAANADNEPARAYEYGRRWVELGADMIEEARLLERSVGATEAGWGGAAGAALREAVLGLMRWCGDAGLVAEAMGKAVSELGAAAEATMRRMPVPGGVAPESALAAFAGRGDPSAMLVDLRGAVEQTRSALSMAVAVMVEWERWCAQIDEELPACPPRPGVGVGTNGGHEQSAAQPTRPAAVGEVDRVTSAAAATGAVSSAGGLGHVGSSSHLGGGSGALGAVPLAQGARRGAVRPGRSEPKGVPVPSVLGGGRAPAGTGMVGAPGAAMGAGAGGRTEHKTSAFIAGEKVFEVLEGATPVIGDNWLALDDEDGADREGTWR